MLNNPAVVAIPVEKIITFTGVAGLGEVGTPVVLWTIVGRVHLVAFTAFCTTNCVSTGTLSVGVASVLEGLIANTVSNDIDQDDMWTAATPTDQGLLAIPSPHLDIQLSESIIVTPLTTDTTGGVIEFHARYIPITDDGSLT